MALKLQQGQVWKHGNEFIRIVHLERLEVAYKVVKNLKSGQGEHRHTSKKDFCRLLKECRLLTPKAAEPLSGEDGPASAA
jgi:hypothetical protein